jgi:hypothetical protein
MTSETYELAPPPAHAMLESLRGVGYSIAAALADIVDNSIAASASNVWVKFGFRGPDSWITITDDGSGMDESTLKLAMTLGAVNPLSVRRPGDLGRFGLGLKTASFSQARCLTVVSRQRGTTAVRRWDLDYIARQDVDQWRLLCDSRVGTAELIEHIEGMPSGTVVVWQGLDRVTAGMLAQAPSSEDAFLAAMEEVERHLAMVFHRFLEGPTPQLRLHMNGARIKPWDPFLRQHSATEASPVETFHSANGPIELQGFVLPHKDQIEDDVYTTAAGPHGWTAQQGFYVYRNRRMLVSGGWLGLGAPRVWTMEEPFKLARLSIEFANTADEEWEIDVKKSVARPPRWLRPRVTELAEAIRGKARRVFAHRGSYGKRSAVSDLQPAWLGVPSAGSTVYRINRRHPVVECAIEQDGREAVEDMLRVVEETVPIQRIWLDAVEKGEIQKEAFEEAAPPEVEALARRILKHLTGKVGLTRQVAIATLRASEPFQIYPTMLDALDTEDALP